jgi:hypothetical protein
MNSLADPPYGISIHCIFMSRTTTPERMALVMGMMDVLPADIAAERSLSWHRIPLNDAHF